MPEAKLDVLTLVSSDKRSPLEVSSLMVSGEVRLVHTFRTGSECLRALSLDDLSSRRVVLIDSLVSDISPANLCDAIRMAHPQLSVLLVVEQEDVEGVQRAMLAGAKATISRGAGVSELSRVLERVIESACMLTGKQFSRSGSVGSGQSALSQTGTTYAAQSFGDYGNRGVVVPFIGARGGAGRSTLSSSLAFLAAEAHIDTALIDFDLQFGDLGFIFGSTGQQSVTGRTGQQSAYDSFQSWDPQPEHDLFAFLEEAARNHERMRSTESLRRFGRQIMPNVHLYAPPVAVEKTEKLAQYLPEALDRLRSEHELLLINTGAYWTLFHTELIEQSDLALCLFDQSIVGIRATSVLCELCRRLGIPSSRLLLVMNKARQAGLSPQDVAEALSAEKVFSIRDQGFELSMLFDSGDFAQLNSETALMAELFEILDEIAIRSDLCVHDAVRMRFAMRREASAKKGLLRRA